MNLIVAYDIAHPRRLQRVARVLKDYGVRVQNSIFEVDIDPRSFREMRSRTEELLDPLEDGVKYFPLCGRCGGMEFSLGPEADQPQGPLLIL